MHSQQIKLKISNLKSRKIKFNVRFLLALHGVSVGLASPAFSAVTVTELEPDTAFVVNGASFGIQAYQALSKAIQRQTPDASEVKVLSGLVENHLLASVFDHSRHAEQTAAAGAHQQITSHDHLEQRNKLWQEYSMLIGQLFPVEMTVAIEQRCIKPENIDSSALKKMLGSDKSEASKIVDTNIADTKKSDAVTIVVARIDCADSHPVQVTLADILESTDEASALQLWRGETTTLQRLVGTLAKIRLHEGVLLQQKQLKKLDLVTLWQVAQDKQARIDFEAEAGVNFEMHHSPESVHALMDTVTEQEIDTYYDKHKEDYQQIAKVTARHITVSTQEEADRVVDEIRAGMSFSDAVARYSLAEDKKNDPPGALGVINRTDKNLAFVKKLALILPSGEVSNSFRMLDGKTYEILWVDKREAEHLPKSDLSVRSEIRREVATLKARDEFGNTTRNAWEKATIVLNKRHFTAPWVATWPAQ